MIQTHATARETVVSLIDALNAEKFDEARLLAHDDMQFAGAMGTRDGAEAYFSDMRRMKLKYAVQKTFVESEMSAWCMSCASTGSRFHASGSITCVMARWIRSERSSTRDRC